MNRYSRNRHDTIAYKPIHVMVLGVTINGRVDYPNIYLFVFYKHICIYIYLFTYIYCSTYIFKVHDLCNEQNM